ncbi:hypothetical protein [Microbaculum marinum]|uniref:Uncharacterized protein n=1 Tax=Microbaculum marinum TaxID=1764581 RepID=A0AAW9RPA0_9HYPH
MPSRARSVVIPVVLLIAVLAISGEGKANDLTPQAAACEYLAGKLAEQPATCERVDVIDFTEVGKPRVTLKYSTDDIGIGRSGKTMDCYFAALDDLRLVRLDRLGYEMPEDVIEEANDILTIGEFIPRR